MKVLVAVGKTSITVDTDFTNPKQIEFIEDTLKALCYTINGTDYGEQWEEFRKLVSFCALTLKTQLEQR